MLINLFPEWHLRDRAKTEPYAGKWQGIAIGPNSDEGLILVNGELLQAGRVLPMVSEAYSIEHVRPIDLPEIGFADEGRALESIRSLSVILYSTPPEMGAEVARPNGLYDATLTLPGGGAHSARFAFPFVGRRQALFNIVSDIGGAAWSYKVYGHRYQRSARGVSKFVLHSEPVAAVSADNSLAFYVGGTDDAEDWDALSILITSATASIWQIDADTIGELGCR